MNFLKGFGKMMRPGGASATLKAVSHEAADRAALKAGAKYVEVGTPARNFNASGFLPKSSK